MAHEAHDPQEATEAAASEEKKIPVQTETVSKKELILPAQVISQADVSRLGRELETLDDFFNQGALKGASAKTVPQTSLSLKALVTENDLNLLHKTDRARLKTFMEYLRTKAPVVNASFATDPKTDFLMKLVTWFRNEAHPYVLLQTGLQPNIAAGCVIRTTNKYFDFSFRQQFQNSKAKLAPAIEKAGT